MSNNSRLAAAEIISQWLINRHFPDRLLAKVEDDRAFVTEVVNGVVRSWNILQWLERGLVRKEPEPFFKAVESIPVPMGLVRNKTSFSFAPEFVQIFSG